MTYRLNAPLHLASAASKCELFLHFIDLPVEVYRIKWEELGSP